MTRRPLLSAVTAPPPPLRIKVDGARAELNYPGSMSLQHKWMEACLYMQSRPGRSLWILDHDALPSKWRGLPVKDEIR